MRTRVLYTLAVIADLQSDAVPLDIESNLDRVRVCVFEGVCKCLLRLGPGILCVALGERYDTLSDQLVVEILMSQRQRDLDAVRRAAGAQ